MSDYKIKDLLVRLTERHCENITTPLSSMDSTLYGDAAEEITRLRANLKDAESLSNNMIFDYSMGKQSIGDTHPAQVVPEGWRLLPEDLATHLGDWRMACKIAAQQPDQQDGGAACYWDHQLKTLDNIEAMLSAAKEQA
jgi:hypothetical protein